MSANPWRNGGYYFPPSPPDPRFHGHPNYLTYNNPSYFCAIPPPQHHTHLTTHQPSYHGFYPPQNNLHWSSHNNRWRGPVPPFTPPPVQPMHPAIFQRQIESFNFQATSCSSSPSLNPISHTKPSKFNPKLQRKQKPSSIPGNAEVSGSKKAFDNTSHTPETTIAVTQHTKNSTQWPKPDIELVVKDIAEPSNARKRKRNNKKNRKEKVKKEPHPELMHYYNKNMARDPWLNMKPVVGTIVKKWAVDFVNENKGKCEGVVKTDYSKRSLADCIAMTFEEIIDNAVYQL